jgi:hypothetical protein
MNHTDSIVKKKPSPTEYATQHDDANAGIRRPEYLFPLDALVPPNQIHHNGNDREHEKKVNPSTQRIGTNHAKNPEDH